MHWTILTGEYPPQPGGVSDYTQMVARALAAAGDTVQIWVPPSAVPDEPEVGVTVHRLPDCFGSRSRAEMDCAFARQPEDARLLVQYVPHAFGSRAMNLPFCVWLWRRRQRGAIRVMFHEVCYPWVGSGRILRHNFLSLVNRIMAALLVRSARRIYLSIPGWAEVLCALGNDRPTTWLPVPSTMPQVVNAARVEDLRARLLGAGNSTRGRHLVGHFGTFGAHVAAQLRKILPPLLAALGSAAFLCVGRGSTAFVRAWQEAHPTLAARLLDAGELTPSEVAEHLAACDLLVQPYPDGISSRRTSAMAGLALGRPLLATRGHLTEPIWEASGAVRLVDAVEEIPTTARALLADPGALARLGDAGEKLYRERFELRNTIDRLRTDGADADFATQA